MNETECRKREGGSWPITWEDCWTCPRCGTCWSDDDSGPKCGD